MYPEELPSRNGRPCFDLQAVVVHFGMDGAGHFYTYSRTSTGTWRRFDDSRRPDPVSNVSEVLRVKAYVLFYVRR